MKQAAQTMNRLGKEKTPFLFIIDFGPNGQIGCSELLLPSIDVALQ